MGKGFCGIYAELQLAHNVQTTDVVSGCEGCVCEFRAKDFHFSHHGEEELIVKLKDRRDFDMFKDPIIGAATVRLVPREASEQLLCPTDLAIYKDAEVRLNVQLQRDGEATGN